MLKEGKGNLIYGTEAVYTYLDAKNLHHHSSCPFHCLHTSHKTYYQKSHSKM